MSRFNERMQELQDLADELNDDTASLIVLKEHALLHKLVRKHMDSLESMYRGRINSLLQQAMQAYMHSPSQRQEFLRPYMLKPDEVRYVEAIWKALDAIPRPDYLPSDD